MSLSLEIVELDIWFKIPSGLLTTIKPWGKQEDML